MDKINLLASITGESFDLRSALDLFLLTLVIFFSYHTLRRLGTWKVVLGVIIAVMIFIVAKYLQLDGVMWIYSSLSQVALIALIVIFQPEIRKLFERVASLRRVGQNGNGTDLASMIARASFALAEQSRGAITVIPGREPVEAAVAGGIPLFAEPSMPLILSLFDPNSPGHDGALIVEDGKLTRYGVRLPASKSGRLSEEYGTRHHAAMGLSEATDALIVVVSEERGEVSVFTDGRMTRISREARLVEIVKEHMDKASTPLLRMPLGRKWQVFAEAVLSMVLAFMLWSAVVVPYREIIERTVNAPVEFTATPDDLAMTGDKPVQAKLHLAGPKSDLDSLDPKQMAIKIDLSKTSAGTRTVIINRDDVNLPPRVKLLDVEPDSLQITLEEITENDAAVKPQLVGKLKPGLKIDSVSVSPEKIKVLSPSSGNKKEKITVMTTPIYLENISETTTIYAKVIAPPSIQPAGNHRWPDVQITITLKQDQARP